LKHNAQNQLLAGDGDHIPEAGKMVSEEKK